MGHIILTLLHHSLENKNCHDVTHCLVVLQPHVWHLGHRYLVFWEPEVTLFGQEGGAENLRTGGASNLSIRPLPHTSLGHQFYSKWDHNLLNKHYVALKSF